jgi:hypothetical protein
MRYIGICSALNASLADQMRLSDVREHWLTYRSPPTQVTPALEAHRLSGTRARRREVDPRPSLDEPSQGFHAFDLVCYVIGVALGVGLELIVRRRRTRGAG